MFELMGLISDDAPVANMIAARTAPPTTATRGPSWRKIAQTATSADPPVMRLETSSMPGDEPSSRTNGASR